MAFFVSASDLVGDRTDFLMEWQAPESVRAIVTNPPFMLADHFVRHGLKLVPTVAMLLRLNFSDSERRSDIIDGGSFARVHFFADRLPRMHPLIGPTRSGRDRAVRTCGWNFSRFAGSQISSLIPAVSFRIDFGALLI